VLSIEGGGARGIIPARVLEEIEARTHMATADLFHVISGTSTGAALGMGLNLEGADGELKFSAREIKDFYFSDMQEIFPDPSDTWGIMAPKYYGARLEEVLKRQFADATLEDTRTDFFVTAFETTEYQPWHFCRSQLDKHPEWKTVKIRDLLAAACAAPTYLPPKEIQAGQKHYNFIDGGVFANNPSLYAAVYAQEAHRPCDIDVLCSLGTGTQEQHLDHSDCANWGIYGWGFNIIQVMMAGQSEATHQALHYLLPTEEGKEDEQTYYRYQDHLRPGTGGLDQTDAWSMQALLDFTDEMIEERDDDINRMCRRLLYNVNDGLV
jgi:patatin-like phospholipase/acyl hydrolase